MMCDAVLLAMHQSGVAEAHTWEKQEAVVELGSSRGIQAPYFEFQSNHQPFVCCPLSPFVFPAVSVTRMRTSG